MSGPRRSALSPTSFTGAKWTALIFAGAVITLVAWLINVAQLYWMAGMLFLLPQLSRLFAVVEQSGLEIERELPGSANQGDLITVRYRVRNLQALPKLHLGLSDELPQGLAAAEPMPIPIHVPPREEIEQRYSLIAKRRGFHRIPGVELESTDMLGISVRKQRLELDSEILVYPRIIPLPEMMIPPRSESGRSSEESALRKGEGAGFYGIREYRPGDPLRHVHWRTAARLGRLTVVEWEAEEARDALVFVDTRAALVKELGPGTTLDAAAGLAASLANALLERGDTVRLVLPGTTTERPLVTEGAERMRELLDGLARMEPQEGLGPLRVIEQLAGTLVPGTRVCWLGTRTDEEYHAAVRMLHAAGFPVATYLLTDAEPGSIPAVGPAGEPIFPLRTGDALLARLLE